MTSSPVQQAAPFSKKSNKIWIIVVVVLLILCCVCSIIGGVAGYFYYQNNASKIGDLLDPLAEPSDPNEAKPGEEIRSESGGYAFKAIPGYKATPGWVNESGYDLESKEIDFTDPNFIVGEGPQMILDGVVPSSNLTFDKYIKNGKNDMKSRLNATISGEPQVTVAGLTGAAFDYDYELDGAGKMKARDVSVEVNPGQFFMIQCRSSVEKWDKTLAACEEVINSITFFDPKPKN
jgi:hypothetical protein